MVLISRAFALLKRVPSATPQFSAQPDNFDIYADKVSRVICSSEKWLSTCARARRASASRAVAPRRERGLQSRRRAPPASPAGTRQPVRASGAASRRRQHRLGHRAEIGDDDRRAHRLRLHRGAPEGLRLGRGHGDDGGGEERRRHVGAMADARDDALRGRPCDQRVELAHVAVAALRVAGQHEAHVRRSRAPASSRAASISTRWPFQAVSRAASSTTRSCGATPQALRSASTRAGSTAPGENVRRSVPRWMTRTRSRAHG